MIRKQAIFEQFPDRPMSHCGTLVEIQNDSLQVAWFSGTFETSSDMAILTSKKKAFDADWSEPTIMVSNPKYAVGQPVFLVRGNDEIWFFFVMIMNTEQKALAQDFPYNSLPPADAWHAAQPFIQKSYDLGNTWHNPIQLMDYPGLMFRGRPMVVKDRIIVPAYDEKRWASRMLISDDHGDSWWLSEEIVSSPGNIHASLIKFKGDQIIAYLRPGGDGGLIWRIESHDLGETWTVPKPTNIPNPNSGFDLLQLVSGRLLLAFNDSFYKRTPLCLALADENENWFYKYCLEDGPGEYSYPSLIQTKDGLIHIVYTYQRKHIEYARFSEEWMLADFERRIR
jgi:predicted neuraminidase